MARWDRPAAALFGLAYFIMLTSVRVLDPRNIEVVAAGDAAYHALARDFAQWDTWHWPITRIDNYLWPVGTSSVFTDANPWLVLASKLLLPQSAAPFQLVGPWMALCFALQGWFGARIAALATTDRLACALAGALFVTAPVLAHRMGHDTLCAHWILLALLEAALRARGRDARDALQHTALVITFAAGLHPTLFAMAMPLALVSAFRHALPLGRRQLLGLTAVVAGPALVWLAFGTVGSRVDRSTFGFGYFSANLLSLFDPYDSWRSTILPPLPHGAGQYEGFGYLGMGVIALSAVGLLVARPWRRIVSWRSAWFAVGLATSASAVFALSSRVLVGPFVFVDLSTLYRPFNAVTDPFRSSGRFVWPLHYFVVAAAVVAVARLPTRRRRFAIASALLLQLVDARHVEGRGAFTLDAPPASPSAAWRLARGAYVRLVLDPPQIETNVPLCPEDHHAPAAFLPFAWIARSEHLAFNSGQAARVDEGAFASYCAATARTRRTGPFDAATIYVRPLTDPVDEVDDAWRSLTCRPLDGARVCVRSDRDTAFLRLLGSERGPRVALDDDPRVAFRDGFGPAEGHGEDARRNATGRASLTLQRTRPGAFVVGFVARAPGLGLTVDGREATAVRTANGVTVGTFEVPSSSGGVVLTFDVARPDLPWQLLRLEWFLAE